MSQREDGDHTVVAVGFNEVVASDGGWIDVVLPERTNECLQRERERQRERKRLCKIQIIIQIIISVFSLKQSYVVDSYLFSTGQKYHLNPLRSGFCVQWECVHFTGSLQV